MKYYLAHPFEPPKFRKFVKEVIQPALFEGGIQVLNPFDGRIWENLYIERSDPRFEEILGKIPQETPKTIVERDLSAIDECDGLIAYGGKLGVGTAMETFYNSFMLGRGKTKTIFIDNGFLSKDRHYVEMFTTVIDGKNKPISTIVEEIKETLSNSEYVPAQLPSELLEIDPESEIHLTEYNFLDAIKIIYVSRYLKNGRENTVIRIGKNIHENHPWLQYFSTVVKK